MNVSAVDEGDRGEGYSPVSGDDGGCLDTSGNESIPDLAVHSPETPSSDSWRSHTWLSTEGILRL